ncbi:MAG: general secretion pathway protein GspK [Planctomycetes bacterium]|nr:general secretion pathway protein GspK [Planctomycetota bacterium]
MHRLRKQDGTIDPTAETQFKRLMKTLGHTEETANDLMENIADYLDENTQGEYETDARNDKFIMPEELLFLEKATEDIIYGKTEDDKTTPGLLQYITTWSSGQININTASSEVLQCLSDKMTPEIANAIISYRQETGENGKPKSFKNIQDLRLVTEVAGEVFADISNYVTTTSTYFSAIITCQNSKLAKGSRTVLQRTPKGTKQVFFDIDYTPKAIIRPEIKNE